MALIRRISIVGLIAVASCMAWGQKPAEQANCEIFHGKGLNFRLCAPNGWVLDSRIKHDVGIYAAFYPQGSSWDKAKASSSVMYVSTVRKHPGLENVETLMTADVEQTRVLASGVQVKAGEPIATRGGGKALVQRFDHSVNDRTEAVAYLDTPEVIVMFSISSKDDKTFAKDYPKFVEMVGSYEKGSY